MSIMQRQHGVVRSADAEGQPSAKRQKVEAFVSLNPQQALVARILFELPYVTFPDVVAATIADYAALVPSPWGVNASRDDVWRYVHRLEAIVPHMSQDSVYAYVDDDNARLLTLMSNEAERRYRRSTRNNDAAVVAQQCYVCTDHADHDNLATRHEDDDPNNLMWGFYSKKWVDRLPIFCKQHNPEARPNLSDPEYRKRNAARMLRMSDTIEFHERH
jgi:hypothetical protein